MSHVYFIGDTHFGHENIIKFRTQFYSEYDHRHYIIEKWHKLIRKRDVVYVMGDAAFTQGGLDSFHELPGTKVLVRGNHDMLPTEAYLSVFKEVYGLLSWKGRWLSHAPIHPSELHGKTNIHGHCHRGGPTDVVNAVAHHAGWEPVKATYFNTCAEHLPEPYTPIRMDAMNELIEERLRCQGST